MSGMRPTCYGTTKRIVTSIFKKEADKKTAKANTSPVKAITRKIRSLLGMKPAPASWLRNTEAATEDVLIADKSQSYQPIVAAAGKPMNRILDNAARAMYRPAVDKLTALVPLTMAKKIAEANVQQAFVFDTFFEVLKSYKNPSILCVGSYEDTAAMSLRRMGFKIDEIDPVLNYYLQEFYTKPTTVKNSYDIVFSTSVIEHDPDDESFMKCIEGLLAPGGTAIITCDYKDGWKPGDPKPEVDARFYTMHDLTTRLLSYIPQCRLVDTPQWECPAPDFNYLGKYQYTFATFVVQKQQQ